MIQDGPCSDVPAVRTHVANSRPARSDAQYVLYWMIAARRTRWNFALQRAVDWARQLNKPLLVFEALRSGYPWASDRLHHFVVQGMADNSRRLEPGPLGYYAYLEPEPGAGRGLLMRLAEQAAVVVTDEFPCFFLPRMVASAAERMPVRCETVDGNGLLPLRAAERVFARAFDFRRFLQKNLLEHLADAPQADPLKSAGKLPPCSGVSREILKRWPAAEPARLAVSHRYLDDLPIDHQVAVAPLSGGSESARRALTRFLDQRLARYDESRNQPAEEVTSGLSPYLHFGHISAHEVFARTMDREQWTPARVAAKAGGQSQGWWGTSSAAESFLDELITWREVGYNMCWLRDDYDRYESLPDWARRTLEEHAGDPRPHTYTLEQFESADTHDELWNAAQRQLVREGRIHNYLRMLWGKKILHWTPDAPAALDVMIQLNNKYALDGRNPNSYSGIFWVLGRYDRAWGPERPVFGKVRYMSSDNTARKVKVTRYLQKYAAVER